MMINVKTVKRILVVGLLALLIDSVGADAVSDEMKKIWELHDGIKTVAAALGVLVISYAGFMWIMANNPEERYEAKKVIIYVMMALLIVAMTKEFVQAVYCETLDKTSYGAGVC